LHDIQTLWSAYANQSIPPSSAKCRDNKHQITCAIAFKLVYRDNAFAVEPKKPISAIFPVYSSKVEAATSNDVL
jgi:hypothetical protein